MADHTKIAWTTHTFNPWIGCTKVGPGCDSCYAEAWNQRLDAGANWGPGAPRRRTTVQNWNKPLRWQRERCAALDREENPPLVRVFCASLADVFDNEVPTVWRDDLWALVSRCPDLEWQFVTKRVGNVAKMAPANGFPKNVIVIATIVNQAEADRDLDKLVNLKRDGLARFVGVSYEPALGPVDWLPWIILPRGLDWVIIGGESSQGGAKARPFDVAWARSTIMQCRDAGVPAFMKQLGAIVVSRDWPAMPFPRDRAGTDPAEWPDDLRVREFPRMSDDAYPLSPEKEPA